MPAKAAVLSAPLSSPLQQQLDRIEELLASMYYIVDVQMDSIADLRAQVHLLLDGARVH
jgi:hypothetical protein